MNTIIPLIKVFVCFLFLGFLGLWVYLTVIERNIVRRNFARIEVRTKNLIIQMGSYCILYSVIFVFWQWSLPQPWGILATILGTSIGVRLGYKIFKLRIHSMRRRLFLE